MAVRHHIKVLVIDDDPTICKTVGLLLEEHGYSPRSYTSPDEAITAAEKESFQIALIDLRMPSMDGVQVVERLKAIDDRTSCIVMTAYPDLDSATETMRRGTCDYIAKPFKQEELVSSVDRACQRMGIIYTDEHELNRLIGQIPNGASVDIVVAHHHFFGQRHVVAFVSQTLRQSALLGDAHDVRATPLQSVQFIAQA